MINRPNWDEYFLMVSFTTSLRSQDPDIQHGCVIVNERNHIIATGYNNPIKGCNDDVIPYNIRDEKRKWMIHAEENAMLNVTQSSSERGDSCRMYITGYPCNNCLQRIVNFGIKKIIIADRMGTITENEETKIMKNKIIEMANLEIIKIPMSNFWLSNFSNKENQISCMSHFG